MQDHKLITANVGNSRAIAVNKFRQVRRLTEDHVPQVPAERKRIERFGGRVAEVTNGPAAGKGGAKNPSHYRVFSKDKDIAGMPISRSLGDTAFHKVGVSCEPEIKHFVLEEDEQILILASDGIWELMTLQNVA